MNCQYCREPLFESELDPFTQMHIECGFRCCIGSLAHLQGLCGCFVPGSQENDPPGLSLRKAARAAFGHWLTLTPEEREAALLRPRLSEQTQTLTVQ